jgi:hypothetical protein
MMDRTGNEVKLRPGTGVLVVDMEKEKAGNSLTLLDHGNIDFEIQFMLAPEADVSILFQGLYSIRLKDSWGEKNSRYTDCGGISLINDAPSGSAKIIRRPPLYNACGAPGLWQKLRVSFEAPAFNAQGEKIKNARFNKVVLNGVTIHENIECPSPTSKKKRWRRW